MEVTFRGEKVATYADEHNAYTLYRAEEGELYVYWATAEGGWLEVGRDGGLTERTVRGFFPALAEAVPEPTRE